MQRWIRGEAKVQTEKQNPRDQKAGDQKQIA